MQALIVTLLCGSVVRKMYAKYHAQGAGTKSPIELPYSSFLDLIEDSDPKGKSSVIVDNVGISPKAIMNRATKPETAEHEEKHFVVYSRKVAASPELLDHLRNSLYYGLFFENPSAAHSAFSFSPTMTMLALELCSILVHRMNENTTKSQRRKSPSWRRARTRHGRRLDFLFVPADHGNFGARTL
jgi:hypothetical protein